MPGELIARLERPPHGTSVVLATHSLPEPGVERRGRRSAASPTPRTIEALSACHRISSLSVGAVAMV